MGNWVGPFKENSILDFVQKIWAKEEEKMRVVDEKQYHDNFIKSVAG